MLISYYAMFFKENNEYWLKFPDLPGCFSCGENIEKAKKMGKEAMELYLHGLEVDKIPTKTEVSNKDNLGDQIVLISAELQIKDGKLYSNKVI